MGNSTPSNPPAPEPRASVAAVIGDPKALIRSIIGTAIGLATLLLMLAGLLVQQNAGVNARIDDLNASVNARIDDTNARIDDLQEDIRELRALILEAIQRADPAN